MTLEESIHAHCSAGLVSRIFGYVLRAEADQADLFEHLRQNLTTESAACHMAAIHHIGTYLSPNAGTSHIGAFLAAYADVAEALTDEDRDLITKRIETFADVRDEKAALILEYMILLRIDMRAQFSPLIDEKSSWTGQKYRTNVCFLALLHRGLFGSPYVDETISGLRTLKDPDEVVNHLLFVSEIAPEGHKRIFEAFSDDPRMTAPHFTNPERVGDVARSLLGL